MKTIFSVICVMFLVACLDVGQIQSNSRPQSDVQITGLVSDCRDGKEYRMPRIDIYAYRLGSAPQIEQILVQLRRTVSTNPEGFQEFFDQYEQLLDLVGRTPPEKHERTNRTGVYQLSGLAKNTRYLVLMIGYLEDQPAFYDWKETARLNSGTLEMNFSMGTPEACGTQKSTGRHVRWRRWVRSSW